MLPCGNFNLVLYFILIDFLNKKVRGLHRWRTKKQVIHKFYEEIRGSVQSRTALCPRLYPSSYPSGFRTSCHWRYYQEHVVSLKNHPLHSYLFNEVYLVLLYLHGVQRQIGEDGNDLLSSVVFSVNLTDFLFPLSYLFKRAAFPVTGKSWLFLRATMRSDYLFRVFRKTVNG